MTDVQERSLLFSPAAVDLAFHVLMAYGYDVAEDTSDPSDPFDLEQC